MEGRDSEGLGLKPCPEETGALASPHDSLQYIGLGTVADCVEVNVTVGGKSCQHELRGDVVICPLPSSLQLDKDGAPLQVGSSAGPLHETWARACRLGLSCHLPPGLCG